MYLFYRCVACYFLLSVFAICSFTYFLLTLFLLSLSYPIYSVHFVLISSYSVPVIYGSARTHRYTSLHPRKKYCVFTFIIVSFSYFLFFHSYFFFHIFNYVAYTFFLPEVYPISSF
jgi:hypothetical protein